MTPAYGPAFQFYPGDWLGSERVSLMTLEEEGAYIRLLAYCWRHGSIPSNPERIVFLLGKGASTTLATTVSTMFQPDPNDASRLLHDRLDAEREKQKLWREKSRKGGKKSAASRKKKQSRVVEPPYQPKGNSSSSFAFAFSSSFLSLFTENLKTHFCFAFIWSEWEKDRTQRKKTLTEAAVKRQANLLSKFSPCQAVKMVDQSLKHGWQGIFEIKEEAPKKPTSPHGEWEELN